LFNFLFQRFSETIYAIDAQMLKRATKAIQMEAAAAIGAARFAVRDSEEGT
jgi:hypothetical protein